MTQVRQERQVLLEKVQKTSNTEQSNIERRMLRASPIGRWMFDVGCLARENFRSSMFSSSLSSGVALFYKHAAPTAPLPPWGSTLRTGRSFCRSRVLYYHAKGHSRLTS